MSQTSTLRDAYQTFSSCVRAVETGEDFVITCNGKPVAGLIPVSNTRVLTEKQKEALAHFRHLVREGWTLRSGSLDRDALYERRGIYDRHEYPGL